MPRRRSVRPLERLCLASVAENVQRLWARDYAERYADEAPFRYLLGPFDQLAGSLVQELLALLGGRRRLTRALLHLLLVPHLTELSLRPCPALASAAIARLVALRCQHLSSLDLHGCGRIPAAALADLLQALPGLTKLGLSETQCDARVLSAAGGSCRRLRELAVSRCRRLSAASLLLLARDPSTGAARGSGLQVLEADGLEAAAGSRDWVRALAFLLLALPSLKALRHDLLSEAVSLIHAQHFDGACLAPGFPSLGELARGRQPPHGAQERCGITLPLKRLAEVGEPLLPAVAAVCPDVEEVAVLLGDSPGLGHGFPSWKTLTHLTLDCTGNQRPLRGLLPVLAGLGAQLHSLSLGGFFLTDEQTFHTLLSHCSTLRVFSAFLAPPAAWGASELQPESEALQGFSSLRPLESPQLQAFSLIFAPCECSSSPPTAVVLTATLVSLLRHSPCLETLALIDLPFSLDKVFERVLAPPGAALRHLQRLSLAKSNVSPGTLRWLLSSDNQLSHVALGGCPAIHQRHHSELLRLVHQQGLDVCITWD